MNKTRIEFAAAAAVSAWILVLHALFLFHAGPLWRDEVGTIDFAAMPTIADLWHNLQYDNFPPLFVGVARLWTLIGMNSDFSYRILGFLMGVATLAVLWFGARSLGAKTPILALALYAANPLSIRFGDAMRPYGLGIILTLLTFVLTWRFLEKPGKWTLVCATLAAILSVQCLYQNALYVAAFSVAAWGVAFARKQRKIAVQVLVIGVAAAVSLLPHWGNIAKAQDWRQINSRSVGWNDIWGSLLRALNTPGAWLPWIWAGLAALALGVAIYFALRSRDRKMIYCAKSLAMTALFQALFLHSLGMLQQPWYFLIFLAPAALAIDVILAGTNSRAVQVGRISIAVLLVLATGSECWKQSQWRQTNIDCVASIIKLNVKPGDVVLVSPWYYGVSLQRYYPTNAWTTLPPMDELRIHRYDLMKKAMLAENPIGPLLDQIGRALREGHSLWVAGDFQFPPPGQPQPVYPPYQGGMNMADATYFSSWMFQISSLVQSHATLGGAVPVPVPDNATVNPLENVPLLVFRGWK